MLWPPRSLSVRLFIIVLGGVIMAIAISNTFHHHDRKRIIEEYRQRTAVEHLLDAIRFLAPLPPSLRITAINVLPRSEWAIEFGSLADNASGEAVPTVADAVADGLADLAQVEGAWIEQPTQCDEEMPSCSLTARVRVRFLEGQTVWLAYTPIVHEPPRRLQWAGFRSRDFIVVGIMAAVAWLVVRIALRPLRRMAQAAENFGRDIAHPPIDDSGPTEVRQAAQAFNAMQKQIRSYIAERTQILAAVTHDLKTPLTRMRLRSENCTDETLKDRLMSDLATMESMVEEGLELARSLNTVEPVQPVDLDALLQSLCDDAAEAGQNVTYQRMTDSSVLVAGRPNALDRVFINLIDNAVKYGRYARVFLEQRGYTAYVRICDGGPGIPDEHLQDVLKPFVRLEASRCRDTGGTGLGLAIAENLLKTQQGEISLRNLPQGGLEVAVQMPMTSAPMRTATP